MRKLECANLLKELIIQLKDVMNLCENSDEIQTLQKRFEELENDGTALDNNNEMQIIEAKIDEIVQSYQMQVLETISKEQMNLILNIVSLDFLEEYHIPLGAFGEFEEIMDYVIKNVEPGNFSFYNNMLLNDNFVQSVSHSGRVLATLLTCCNNEEQILNCLNNLTYDLGQADYTKNNFDIGNDNWVFGMAYSAVIDSANVSLDFKKKLLQDDQMLFYVSNYDLSSVIQHSKLPKDFKRKLILKPNVFNKLSDHVFSETIGSLCDNYDDYQEFFSTDKILAKINFGWLFRSSSISFLDLKKILFDEKVYERLDWLSLRGILSDTPMSFEQRKELLLHEKIYSKLNDLSIANILSSKYLKPEERINLLNNDKISSVLTGNKWDPKGGISILLQAKALSPYEKLSIIRDERFSHLVDNREILNVVKDSNLSIDLVTEVLFDKNLFYKMIGEYHKQYNPDNNLSKKGPYRYDKYEYVKKLYSRNPYVARTLAYELLNDDILDLGFNFIEKMSKYPKSAISLANVYNYGDKRYLENMLKVIENSTYSKEIDIVLLVNKIISMEHDNSFYGEDKSKVSLLSKIRYGANLDVNNFTFKQWKTITEIGLRDHSSYYNDIHQTPFGPLVDGIDIALNLLPDIQTIDDLDNFHVRRIQLCDDVFNAAIAEKDLDKAKNAYLNKYFNINIQEAYAIVRMYGTSINDFEKNSSCYKELLYIKQIQSMLLNDQLMIINHNYNNSSLKPLTFDETLYIEQSLRWMFGRQIMDSVYKVNNNVIDDRGEQIQNSPKYIDVKISENGIETNQKILVYEPGFDFKMLVHSTAAYGQMELINDNYFDSWNKNSRKSNHGICCSLISNDNLGMAAVNDVLFGFDGWDEKALIKVAPYDIYSLNDEFDLQEGRPLVFMSAQDIINNTRHTHNEMVLERLELRNDKKTSECQNIQPSYVIIYSDMSDDIKQKAVKCSLEMQIPIVYLDKEKIIANEVNKINNKISDLHSTSNLETKIHLLGEILLMHENNRSGLKATNPSWQDKYFPTEKVALEFNMVINELQQNLFATGDIERYYMLSSSLIDILEEENEKFKVTMETTERKNYIDIPVEDYKMSLMQIVSSDLGKNNIPKLDTIIKMDQVNKPDLPLTQSLLSGNQNIIHNAILDIVNKKLYPNDNKNHNINHIERVIFLSQLIGQKELQIDNGDIDSHAMDLLIQAAKYHDCGRDSDKADKNHGAKSVEKSRKFLTEDKYSDEDIKIIHIAIEYHEMADDDTKFDKLCQRYNLPQEKVALTKKIASCLKDADALDRTRFKNPNSKLNSNMLRTSTAKSSIPIAENLNRRYETLDKEQFLIFCQHIANQKRSNLGNEPENSLPTLKSGKK